MDVLCTDRTGTITENRLALAATFPFGEISEDDVLRAAALACDPSTQDPIDLAILSAAAACGLHEKRERLEFLPFDPAHRYSLGRYQSSSGEEYMIKGAPRAVAALTQNTPDFAAKSEQFAAAGNRVLGVASGKSRNNLQLVGYSHSKIRRGRISKASITGLQNLGVQVIMVSGDNVATAAAVAQRVGIGGRAAPAEVLDGLNDGQALEYDVYGRVFPEHKIGSFDSCKRRVTSLA